MKSNTQVSSWYFGVTFLLVLFLVFFPLSQKYWSLDYLYDYKRFASIFLILLTVCPFLFLSSLQQQWLNIWKGFPPFVRYSLSVILVIGILSALFAPYQTWAFLEVSKYGLLFIYIIAIAVFVQQAPSLTKQLLLIIAVSFAGLITFQIGTSYLEAYYTIYPDMPRRDVFVGAYSFVNLRHLNQLQTITLPLVGVAAVYSQPKSKTLFGSIFFVLCAWWFLAFVSGARGTIIAVMIGIVFSGILFHKAIYKWLKVQAGSFLIGGISYYFLFVHLQTNTGRAITRSGSPARLNSWERTISGILEQPFLGHGPMQSSTYGLELNGHNYFLTMAYEWGIPSAFLFSGLLGYALFYFLRQIKYSDQSNTDQKKIFCVGLIATLVAIWSHGFVTKILNPPMSQIWVATCIGIAIGIYYKNENTDYINEKYSWKFISFCTVIISVFIWSVYPSAVSVKESRQEYIEQTESNKLRPRFWHQGKIGWRDQLNNKELNNYNSRR